MSVEALRRRWYWYGWGFFGINVVATYLDLRAVARHVADQRWVWVVVFALLSVVNGLSAFVVRAAQRRLRAGQWR